jgi:hypothetical protein
MPLSEDEQRILRQIEEQLQRDPSFGRDIRNQAASSRRMAVVSGIVALVLLAFSVILLAMSPYIAFAAFIGAMFAAVASVRHLSQMSETGFTQLGQAVRQRFGGRSAPPKG